MLSLQFGVSIFGVVITAAAFMIGLGAGALFGGRWARQISSPLRMFAWLEGGVAIYALSLPLLLRGVDALIHSLGPEALTAWYGLHGVSALALITLPALAMGLGFPLVLQALTQQPVSLARVYGVNTLGGMIGALLPLALLPMLGWQAAVIVIALIGAAVAAGAWWLSLRSVGPSVTPATPLPESTRLPALSLWAYAGVGAAALMLEIAWTRLFGMLLLRTEYVMAIILAVFLLGIGLGSLVSRLLRGRIWFELLPLLAAFFALASLMAVPLLAAWAEGMTFTSLAAAMWQQGMMLAALTLPVTLLLGAWLPLLSHRLGADKVGGGVLYGANAVGAAVGALLAGFVLTPLFGSSTTIVIAALLLLVCGMAWARRPAWLALPVLAIAGGFYLQMPPVAALLPQGQAASVDLMVHEDALAITHVVQQADGQRLLLGDLQRMDASSEPLAVVTQQNQVRLPLMLHPQAESVLFLGLGTAISASASLAYPQLQRTAVELSQGAIDAAERWFTPVNGGVMSQMEVVRDDARRYLRASGQQYDVIIGDLFHPDLVGRSALLSRQQFERAQQRLADGGVFVQWLALNQFDPHSLAVVLRTFDSVFAVNSVFVDGFRVALVGFENRQPSADDVQAALARAHDQALASGGEGAWTWLGRYWGPIAVGDGPIQSEWAPVIEYQLPRARFEGGLDVVQSLQWLLAQRPSLALATQHLSVPAAEAESFERAYIGTELALRAWLAEFQGQTGEAVRLLRMAYQANPADTWISGTMADRMYAGLAQARAAGGLDRRQALQRILELHSNHVPSLIDLWQLSLAAGEMAQAKEYFERWRQLSPLDKRFSATAGVEQ